VELHHLRTFAVVAREGSITRASEILHLSQPAVSAHIKAIEDAVGLTLFERTPRGMSLTAEGKRLLVKAEQTLGAHRELLDEATRMKGRLTGALRIGTASNTSSQAVATLLAALAAGSPGVEVTLQHGTSQDVLAGLRNGSLDAGFYNEGGDAEPDLVTVELGRFTTYVVARPGLVAATSPLDWRALAEQPWIYPASSACCGRTAETLFRAQRIQPRRIIGVDREALTRTLVAQGVGVGLLHADTARDASDRGEVALLYESPAQTRVLFAHLASRAQDPLVAAASAILRP
jgi:DNA-binding transcriptional LysR family regulator